MLKYRYGCGGEAIWFQMCLSVQRKQELLQAELGQARNFYWAPPKPSVGLKAAKLLPSPYPNDVTVCYWWRRHLLRYTVKVFKLGSTLIWGVPCVAQEHQIMIGSSRGYADCGHTNVYPDVHTE